MGVLHLLRERGTTMDLLCHSVLLLGENLLGRGKELKQQ